MYVYLFMYVFIYRRCATQLSPQGVIILKDNVTDEYTYMIDLEDSSVARSLVYHHILLSLTAVGLVIIHESIQTDFPPDLCPVHMMAIGFPTTTTTTTANAITDNNTAVINIADSSDIC